MKERPILMSGAMVLPTLDGTKTQTRRVLKIRGIVPEFVGYEGEENDPCQWEFPGLCEPGSCEDALLVDWFVDNHFCQYGKAGDRLWVRETWCQKADDDDMPVFNAEGNLDSTCVWYAADGVDVRATDGDGFGTYRKDGRERSPWKPSIHMPRWASRITLEILSIRVQRLQEITEADAIAEGLIAPQRHFAFKATRWPSEGWTFAGSRCVYKYPTDAYRALWEKINGVGSWEANPWVAAIEFKKLETP